MHARIFEPEHNAADSSDINERVQEMMRMYGSARAGSPPVWGTSRLGEVILSDQRTIRVPEYWVQEYNNQSPTTVAWDDVVPPPAGVVATHGSLDVDLSELTSTALENPDVMDTIGGLGSL